MIGAVGWWIVGVVRSGALFGDLPLEAMAAAAPPGPQLAGREAAVQALVASRNRASDEERAAFEAAGWTFVAAPEPDHRVVALDPSLLGRDEAALRVQIASTAAGPAHVANLAAIARGASALPTRLAAVEALGRVGDEPAQRALLALLGAGLPEDDPVRREVAPLLRPPHLDHPLAAELAALLEGSVATSVEKRQVALTLALIGLRDGVTPGSDAPPALSPAGRRLVSDAMQLLSPKAGAMAPGGGP